MLLGQALAEIGDLADLPQQAHAIGRPVTDGLGRTLLAGEQAPQGAQTCVAIDARNVGTGYRVVSISTALAGGVPHATTGVTKASRIHLRWREAEHRFVVVGLERDE